MRISIHSYANKTNFHMKSFALSLAFNNEVYSNSEIAYYCKQKGVKNQSFTVVMVTELHITSFELNRDAKKTSSKPCSVLSYL